MGKIKVVVNNNPVTKEAIMKLQNDGANVLVKRVKYGDQVGHAAAQKEIFEMTKELLEEEGNHA